MYAPRNVGGLVTTKAALSPRNQVAAASFSLLGAAIDKKDAHSALFVVRTGAKVGSPSAQTVDAKLQESDDGSSWTDCAATPNNPVAAITQITDIDQVRHLEIDLTPYKAKVRLVFTVAFTGGTTPSIGLMGEAVLGGLINAPPAHA
jgi:hypothetical protein